ncbi:hypothetical protein HOU00_gp163 [Caulobacter phage CcrPW]|uniref:Bacteriophage phiJL001 Gp84 C-terminal domain-containing protein n=1 Tax=Caulobacter phage CcrPW TaxID=2283271 RepID=A0A385EDM7_9CAUD|nr:hypothetical protein HOU00_gp163 [Caulobacter phage CcrPW]AXQ68962.1 hypothetical protein CcrPW_gp423c [Caulobacter phage CcrPW]
MAAVDARKPLQVDGLCPARFGDQSCGYQPGAGETCDKRIVTCRNYGNAANYRGTPKIPLA